MEPKAYLVLVILLLLTGFVVFRLFIWKNYLHKGKLTPFSTFLECLVFCLWGLFTWADLPPNWPSSNTIPLVKVLGVSLIIIGLFSTLAVMIWFGFDRACGLKVNGLKQSGFYSLTRNPQIITGGLAVIGYAMLTPSWHTLGWVLLYAIIAHMMVLTEEEHLRRIFGEEYGLYCKRVPRYLGLPRRLY